MHDTANETGRLFFETYWRPSFKRILDVGALNVNGTLRDHAPPGSDYVGLDMEKGPGVDIVHPDQSAPFPFADSSFDLVVSTSCFEHSLMFWATFLEMVRVVRPGGFIYINAPSNGNYHAYPYDCWRFYPDAGLALAAWARSAGYREACLVESFFSRPQSDIWTDCTMVFSKSALDPAAPLALLSAAAPGCYNVRTYRGDGILGFQRSSDDMLAIDRLESEIAALKAAHDAETGRLKAALAGMEESLSWRMTAPARAVAGFLRRAYRSIR